MKEEIEQEKAVLRRAEELIGWIAEASRHHLDVYYWGRMFVEMANRTTCKFFFFL
jgi:hypothetical protein